MTTSQAGSHKRPREIEGDSSTSNDDAVEKSLPLKRTRIQEGTFQVVSRGGVCSTIEINIFVRRVYRSLDLKLSIRSLRHHREIKKTTRLSFSHPKTKMMTTMK